MTDDMKKRLGSAPVDMNWLKERLKAGNKHFRSHSPRKGVQRSLIAVERYLSENGISHNELSPLRALSTALLDCDRGLNNPLLAPVPYTNGPKRLLGETQILVMCAVVVSLQKEAKIHLKEAATAVSSAIGNRHGAAQIINFRKEILACRTDPDTHEFYKLLHRDLSTDPLEGEDQSSVRRAENALRNLRKMDLRKV